MKKNNLAITPAIWRKWFSVSIFPPRRSFDLAGNCTQSVSACSCETIPDTASWSIFESPYVLVKDGLYYLFVCYARQYYYETFVVAADSHRNFLLENKMTTLYTRAPEFIEIDGETYMSSCGIEDPQVMSHFDLWMCKIKWLRP